MIWKSAQKYNFCVSFVLIRVICGFRAAGTPKTPKFAPVARPLLFVQKVHFARNSYKSVRNISFFAYFIILTFNNLHLDFPFPSLYLCRTFY